jgi:hypothetical protein
VQRERGAERFPAPAQVLVDAGELDLAEKTLILFRHARARGAREAARAVARSAALAIVEHPHFTPERIRRLMSDHVEQLPPPSLDPWRVREAVQRELASPTEAMRLSFAALHDEHRHLLIALLDAPAGLIDERELAATVRRHHATGLSRPPGELIDRLTDHFLRVTPLGIGWVHPSWRDLVIEQLRRHADARQRFLRACGVHGIMLALSREGGIAGERTLPLLLTDADWDALGDRLGDLLGESEDHELARMLLALEAALGADIAPPQRIEAANLAAYVLGATQRLWDRQHRVLPVPLLEAWYALNSWLRERASAPRLGRTWAELRPGPRLLEALGPRLLGPVDRGELARLDDWLALAQVLAKYDPGALETLGFFERDPGLVAVLIAAFTHTVDDDSRLIAEGPLARLAELAPGHAHLVASAQQGVQSTTAAAAERWWVPQDIAAPPSTEPAVPGPIQFTREDVDRVLSDL